MAPRPLIDVQVGCDGHHPRGFRNSRGHQPRERTAAAVTDEDDAGVRMPRQKAPEGGDHARDNRSGVAFSRPHERDVADVAGVGGPVGAELELHDDAGCDAHREVDGEDARPKPGHLVIVSRRCAGTSPP